MSTCITCAVTFSHFAICDMKYFSYLWIFRRETEAEGVRDKEGGVRVPRLKWSHAHRVFLSAFVCGCCHYAPETTEPFHARGKRMLNSSRHKNEATCGSGEGGKSAHDVTQWLV